MKKDYKKIIIRVIAVLALILGLNWGYWSYHHIHSPIGIKPEDLPQIAAVKPKAQSVTITDNYIGQVDAINQAQIVPYISGYIVDIAAEGGQFVKKGEVLATIKQEEYIASLAQAEADVSAAKADLFNARTKYERMQKAGDKAVSPTEMDSAEAEYLTAAAALKKAEAGRENAQTELGYTYLTAPFDGVLGNINMSVGEYVSPQSTGLMDVVQYNPIRVVFSVSDKEYLNHFKNHEPQNLIIRLKLANNELFEQTGNIEYSANQVNDQTGSVAIYVEFANPDRKLMPNAFVEVLLERVYDNVILWPKNRVDMRLDGNYVYVVQDGILQTQKIHIYGTFNNQYVVRDDFAANTFLVTESVESRLLQQKVAIKNTVAE
jgi:membrane fusion protein (multidrug efflux system)